MAFRHFQITGKKKNKTKENRKSSVDVYHVYVEDASIACPLIPVGNRKKIAGRKKVNDIKASDDETFPFTSNYEYCITKYKNKKASYTFVDPCISSS